MRDDAADARALREASLVLAARARRQTFVLRVIIRCLQRAADRIEAR